MRADFAAAHADVGEGVGVQAVHLVAHVRGAGDPVVEDGLREVVEEGVDVDGGRGAGPGAGISAQVDDGPGDNSLHHLTPDLHQIIHPVANTPESASPTSPPPSDLPTHRRICLVPVPGVRTPQTILTVTLMLKRFGCSMCSSGRTR